MIPGGMRGRPNYDSHARHFATISVMSSRCSPELFKMPNFIQYS
jgi:hypothetical protein